MTQLFPNEQRKELLTNLLLAMGCVKVVVHFAGGGDSGSIEDVYVLDKDTAHLAIDHIELEWEEASDNFDEANTNWVRHYAVRLMPLRDILKQMTESALESTGLDWYNNEGGQGNLYIYPTETPVRVELEVGINYTTTDDHSFDFTNDEESEEENAPTSP
jgi:hypothetical protein